MYVRSIGTSRALRLALAVGLSGFALALGGCLGVQRPEFRVADVRVAQETDDGALLVFTIEGENRNSRALPLRDVRYRIVLGDAAQFATHRFAEAALPPLGAGVFELPVPLKADAAAALTNGQRRYRLSADVVFVPPGAFQRAIFDASIYRPSVSFSQRGSLDFDAGAAPAESDRPSDSGE